MSNFFLCTVKVQKVGKYITLEPSYTTKSGVKKLSSIHFNRPKGSKKQDKFFSRIADFHNMVFKAQLLDFIISKEQETTLETHIKYYVTPRKKKNEVLS